MVPNGLKITLGPIAAYGEVGQLPPGGTARRVKRLVQSGVRGESEHIGEQPLHLVDVEERGTEQLEQPSEPHRPPRRESEVPRAELEGGEHRVSEVTVAPPFRSPDHRVRSTGAGRFAADDPCEVAGGERADVVLPIPEHRESMVAVHRAKHHGDQHVALREQHGRSDDRVGEAARLERPVDAPLFEHVGEVGLELRRGVRDTDVNEPGHGSLVRGGNETQQSLGERAEPS